MKCEYCNGKGTYDPFSGPTTECPKCKGTGQVGSTDECNESHLDDGQNHGGKSLAGAYLDAQKHGSKTFAQSYRDSQKRAAPPSRAAAVAAKRAAKRAAKHVTVVSTTIAGTAVRTGDSVEVHTRNKMFTGRYVGILTKIGAVDIQVDYPHGVDTIPIKTIDRLIVTNFRSFATGGAMHLASYPNLPAWAHTPLRSGFGVPRGLGPASYVVPNYEWVFDDHNLTED